MKIVILGAAGQLGRQLGRTLTGDVAALSRADVDVTDARPLRAMFAQHRPSVVVNAAGYTQVDLAEVEPEAAFAVNAAAPRDLALLCRDADSTLIHFSSDYVFGQDDTRSSAYGETDAPGPLNVYGQSKLAGERSVQDLCPKYFILRTCGLHGPLREKTNFVTTMLRLAEAGRPIRVVHDQICTPTSVRDLADATRELLNSQAYGLYHVTNAGSCSWYEFARTIFELAKKKVDLLPITSTEYAAAARRPRYSVLSNAKWIDAGFTALPHWREALALRLASERFDGLRER